MTNLSLLRTIYRSLEVARPTRCVMGTARNHAIAVGIPHRLRRRHVVCTARNQAIALGVLHLLRRIHVLCTTRNHAIAVSSPHLLRHLSVTQAITASSSPWLRVLRRHPPATSLTHHKCSHLSTAALQAWHRLLQSHVRGLVPTMVIPQWKHKSRSCSIG